jgi:hypothetical protein
MLMILRISTLLVLKKFSIGTKCTYWMLVRIPRRQVI